MRKKILLSTLLVMLFVCLFAISVNAATDLKPQDTNAYGDISLFDETITIGRTDTTNGYTPYKADGTSYARVVIGDGTTFYTFPTYYILSKNGGEDYGKIPLFQYDFTSLNAAMGTATGTNPSWGIKNVYRIELPETMTRLNTSGTQKFYGFENVIEIYLPPNSTTIDKNANCLFHTCKNLTTIHNIDTFVFKAGCTGGTFQNCTSLTNLTLAVSPDVTDPGENMFNGCKNLVSVNIQEAFPNLTKIGKQMFNGCHSLAHFSSNSQYTYVTPTSVTRIEQSAFYECKGIKYISISPNVTYVGPAAFHTCTNLQFVEFNGNTNDIDFNNWGAFMKCTNLKAMSLPANVDYMTNRFFSYCANLEAVYLPSALTTIETNGYGDGTAFFNCNNVYFVNEPFSVVDENGNFYGDDFEMPQRPDVYYFPSNLSSLFSNKDSGVGFVSCYNLNPVMVLPEALTKLWIGDGVFYDCGAGSNNASFTVVLLGNMTDVRLGLRDNRAKGVSYVFANPEDVDLTSVNIVDSNANTNKPNFKGDEYIYFCHSNKSFKIFNADAQFTNDNVTWETGTKHIQNPNGATSSDPTCTENQKTFKTCFCEAVFDIVEVENTATGHDLDYRKDGALATLVSVAYANGYHVEGVKVVCCGKCSENIEAEAEILFTGFGISTRIDNGSDVRGMVFSYRVNDLAIKEYNSLAQTALSYGVVATFAQVIGTNNPLDNTGAPTLEKGVVSTNISNSEIYAVDLVIKGTKTLWEEEAYELDLYMLGYVVDENGVTYLGSVDGVSAASQNASDLKTVTYKDYYVTNEEVE